MRVGVGSFDPRFHVKDTTRAARRGPRVASRCATRATGSRTGCATATEDGVFFVGDSAGHCLPLTAEGIRTALYFGIACGRELRAVVEGRADRGAALRALRTTSTRRHALEVRGDARTQRLVPRVPPRLLQRGIGAMQSKRFVDWSFGHYLDIAPPSFAGGGRPPRSAVVADQLDVVAVGV